MVKSAFAVYKKNGNNQNIKKNAKSTAKNKIKIGNNAKTKAKLNVNLKKRLQTVPKNGTSKGKKTTNKNGKQNNKVDKPEGPMELDVKQAPHSNLNVNISHECGEDSFYKLPEDALVYMLLPVRPSAFFGTYWETKPLHIVRGNPKYYNFFTSKHFDEILRNNPLYYTKNIDVVTYENNERTTHNPEGRASAASVWDYYSNECSVRLLNPQTYNKKVRKLLASLQEYFGTMVGANIYLTPRGSQGFAPHYDDIEAFVLQLEGRKHWKLYRPNTETSLPRYSSKNLSRDELPDDVVELTLEAGDLLYFPRGYIHEAYTDSDHHSLHITVSVYQNTAYVDLIEKCLMDSLRAAAASDIEFRRGLPIQYLKHLGTVNENAKTNIRAEVINKVKSLVGKLCEYISVDDGADQMGRKFMYDALPPQLTEAECAKSCKLDGDMLVDGCVLNKGFMELNTEVRFVRYHCMRIVLEENIYKLYYCTENADVYHGEEEQWLEVEEVMVEPLKALLKAYPGYKRIEDLPCKDYVQLMNVIWDLWEKGMIVTKKILNINDN